MNIAIIYIGNDKLLNIARKMFAKELYGKGNIIKEINGILENTRLTGFQYIIFFIESGFFIGKNRLKDLDVFLKNIETMPSKYVSVYTNKKFLSNKYLLKYMSRLEAEGCIIHSSDIIVDEKHSENICRNLSPIKSGS